MIRSRGISGVLQNLRRGVRRYASPTIDNGPATVKTQHLGTLDYLKLKVYTNATRPVAATVGAGAVIFNSDDDGLNVSDGTNWREPTNGWVVT